MYKNSKSVPYPSAANTIPFSQRPVSLKQALLIAVLGGILAIIASSL
ncbi:hypothetical protein [Eoetvoesiella caeni]|uniref:Uncharacterized protein n=1 Tax=Eoetvoesiella caeni TaxID=645616 RepID=A0A366HHC6_9BURK|nr:hypothetical protein [Eoetvoesiella caeni]MCI2808549.1 hypothetical protein [Eoetvoesiella caeni]NYT55089.1 hypothetical protein [Eoetvoesiella caeni]RBP40932.1 hypothetical protein DFR37_103275 [Eoetvoesiella caeni]